MIEKILNWFVETGEMPAEPAPDEQRAAFYLGMQLEELAEKFEVVFGPEHPLTRQLHGYGNGFKNGQFTAQFTVALRHHPKALLDADVDQLWVSLGAARAQGADVESAVKRLVDHNYAKRFDDGTFHRHPETGKILKPAGWIPPDHTSSVHPSLRPGAEQEAN